MEPEEMYSSLFQRSVDPCAKGPKEIGPLIIRNELVNLFGHEFFNLCVRTGLSQTNKQFVFDDESRCLK